MRSLKILLLTLFFSLPLLINPSVTLAQSVTDGQPGLLYNLGYGMVVAMQGCPATQEGLDALRSTNYSLWKCCTMPDAAKQNQEKFICGDYSHNKPKMAAIPATYAYVSTMINHPPASSGEYFADVYQRVSPVKPAYAQGVGFAALSPILGIWKAFRNIAYFLFILIFIGVGFGIMFRAKLNPQTVINIENALPQLVITLILITFSYAIAGLLIDVMFISVYLIIGVFQQTVFEPGSLNLRALALDNNVMTNFLQLISPEDGSRSVHLRVSEGLGVMSSDIVVNTEINVAGQSIDIGSAISGFVSGLSSVLFMIIVLIVILISAFKVFFTLLNSYVMIILNIIISPILLLTNAYPGSNAFMKWLRTLAKHLSAFPVTMIMFFILYALTGTGARDGIGYGSGTGGFQPPLLNFGATNTFQAVLAFGLIMGMNDAIKSVQAFVAGKEAEAGNAGMEAALGGGIGGALGAGLGSVAGTLKAPAKLGSQAYALAQPARGVYNISQFRTRNKEQNEQKERSKQQAEMQDNQYKAWKAQQSNGGGSTPTAQTTAVSQNRDEGGMPIRRTTPTPESSRTSNMPSSTPKPPPLTQQSVQQAGGQFITDARGTVSNVPPSGSPQQPKDE